MAAAVETTNLNEIDIETDQILNSSPPEQNGLYFAYYSFKHISINENVRSLTVNFAEICSQGSNWQ